MRVIAEFLISEDKKVVVEELPDGRVQLMIYYREHDGSSWFGHIDPVIFPPNEWSSFLMGLMQLRKVYLT